MTIRDRVIASVGLVGSAVALLGVLALAVWEQRFGALIWPLAYLVFSTFAAAAVWSGRRWGCYLGVLALVPFLALPILTGIWVNTRKGYLFSGEIVLVFIIWFLPSLIVAGVGCAAVVWLLRLRARLNAAPAAQTNSPA